jgi:hypothetical protein
VLESKVISRPTPIWGGAKGMVIVRNFKVPTLVLTTKVGVATCTTKVTIGKGMILKLVPPLIWLTSWMVTIDCSLQVGLKVDDVAHVVLVLVPIST